MKIRNFLSYVVCLNTHARVSRFHAVKLTSKNIKQVIVLSLKLTGGISETCIEILSGQ